MWHYSTAIKWNALSISISCGHNIPETVVSGGAWWLASKVKCFIVEIDYDWRSLVKLNVLCRSLFIHRRPEKSTTYIKLVNLDEGLMTEEERDCDLLFLGNGRFCRAGARTQISKLGLGCKEKRQHTYIHTRSTSVGNFTYIAFRASPPRSKK